jgi:hypothetical protein
MFMKPKMKWVAAAAVAVLFAGSLGFGSNMGFKFNAPIVNPTAGAPQGDNWVVIPFNSPYGTAQGLCTGLGLTNLSATVARKVPLTGSTQTVVCGTASDFPLENCESVKIVEPTLTSAVIVGSHDPSKTCNLIDNASPGQSAPTGDNFVSIPYHTTAADLEDACADVGPNAQTVAYLDPATGSFVTRVCGSPTTAPPLPLGRGIKVTLSGDANDTTWVPSHF